MMIFELNNPESMQEAAKFLLGKYLDDPVLFNIIEESVMDERTNRRGLFSVAFCHGAMAAFNEMMRDRIHQVGKG